MQDECQNCGSTPAHPHKVGMILCASCAEGADEWIRRNTPQPQVVPVPETERKKK